MQVKLTWNNYKKMWDMWDMESNFIEEFRNCRNLKNLFKGLEKNKDNFYFLSAKKDEAEA